MFSNLPPQNSSSSFGFGRPPQAAEGPDAQQSSGTKVSALKQCDYCCEMVPAKATRCRYCSSNLSSTSSEGNDKIEVVREEVEYSNAQGFKEKSTRVSVIIKDDMIKQTLRSWLDTPELYEKLSKIPADELFMILPSLRTQATAFLGHSVNPLAPLLEFLESEFEAQFNTFESMRKDGLITFELLRHLFPRKTKFFGFQDDQVIGSTVHDARFAKTVLGTMFVVDGEVIKSKGDRFFTVHHAFSIPQFRGTKRIDELSIRPMTDEVLQLLQERGRKFAQIAVGAHHLEYDGVMMYQTAFFRTSWNASGRIMIDGVSFNKFNSNYKEFVKDGQSSRVFGRAVNFPVNPNDDSTQKEIPEDSLFKTWHTVGGFSFRTKKWGEILIENAKPIRFDDHAFERLVLPASRKKLINALVLNCNNSFADIISGKGAGCIFLLHGPPGTGKTLTAEATAEMLHKPLYSVSVGELGVDTSNLDRTLHDILEVASVWNAVVLIDEADIFLERRTDNEIKRNALVGIFLRLLEYHQGIIFLTTNRVRAFDEAFHSRISIALSYPELDLGSRRQVWLNLLEASKTPADSLDVDKLAGFPLNGRQIRTMIRIAQSLAKSENKPVSMDFFTEPIDISLSFSSAMRENL